MINNQKRLCIDLDGTICENKKDNQTYQDVLPMPCAVKRLNEYKEKWYYIIIYTARNMLTHNNNIGNIIANQGPILFEWLKKHNIPYDELLFGKPVADIYIDDKALKFESWDNIKI